MNVTICTRLRGVRIAALAAALGATAPLGAQTALSPQCAQPYGAMSKMFVAPFHLYMVDSAGTDAGLHGGKPTVSEEVFINNTVYVMVEGKWVKSPIDIVEMRKDAMKNLDTSKTTCAHLRDESVGGESASVWSVRSETEDGNTDSIVWVSKGRNLILRTEMRIDVGGALGKSHMVMNYDYANVHAPAGVK